MKAVAMVQWLDGDVGQVVVDISGRGLMSTVARDIVRALEADGATGTLLGAVILRHGGRTPTHVHNASGGHDLDLAVDALNSEATS